MYSIWLLLKVAGQKNGPKNYLHWPPINHFTQEIYNPSILEPQ